MPSKVAPPDASELIDRLYAALFSEAPWQEFVTRSCDLMPNGKSALFFHDKTSNAGALSLTARVDEESIKLFNDYYHSINPWVDHAMERPIGTVMQTDEMLPRADLMRTEFFQDYLRPQDIETGLGVTLHRDQGLHVFFSIISADLTEDQLEHARRCIAHLVPHLNRAFCIMGRGGAKEGSTKCPSGSKLQIDARLRVVAADPGAMPLLAQTEALSIGPLGRLVCNDPDLLSCLHHALHSESPPAVQHRYLKRKSGGPPLHVCLYRPGLAGSMNASGASCFMRLQDPARDLSRGVRRFCAAHGLSEAEGDIVAGLAAGNPLTEIAARRKTSDGTVRTQLKTIFWKTGCNRQADILFQVAAMAQCQGRPITTPILIPDPRG